MYLHVSPHLDRFKLYYIAIILLGTYKLWAFGLETGKTLTAEYLVRILTEPKNAIIKQYQKLLRMGEVNLIFEEDALTEIARTALEKKTGARALRAIIEGFMQDIMYEVPKDDNIGRVTIT